jgi:hypothetical protein
MARLKRILKMHSNGTNKDDVYSKLSASQGQCRREFTKLTCNVVLGYPYNKEI